MARKGSAETELRWRDLVRRQAESGLSVRAFCRQEGISENSLYFWRRELPKRALRNRQLARQEAPAIHRDFIPVHLDGGPSARMELVHPLGYQIRIDGGLNPALLRQLLDVLEQRGES